MTNIDIFNNPDEKISRSEMKALKELSTSPDALSAFDDQALGDLRKNLQNQLRLYSERPGTTTSSKNYVTQLTNNIVKYIDGKIGGNPQSSSSELSGSSGNALFDKIGGTSTSKLDLSNMPKFETTEDGKGHDWMSSLAGKTHGEAPTGKVQVSSLDRSTETTDKFGEAQFQALTQEHINGPNTLKSACSRLGIDPRELQEHLGVKVDGLIGGGTYRAFNNLRAQDASNSQSNSSGSFDFRRGFQDQSGDSMRFQSTVDYANFPHTNLDLSDIDSIVRSSPFERSSSGTTLCSKTARLNLTNFGIPEGEYVRGNAIDCYRALKSQGKISSELPPNDGGNLKVADMYMQTPSRYDHRAVGYFLEGQGWMVLDPYYSRATTGNPRSSEPIPLDTYISGMRSIGRTFMGAHYYA